MNPSATSQPTKPEVLNALEDLANNAAMSMRECMESATSIDAYKHFLDSMYHYTLFSEENLKLAAKCSRQDDMREYFDHMAKEERGHYLLAKRDLEEYGEEVSEKTPEIVERINLLWKEAASHNSGIGFLGIVYVFENIAKHIGPDIKSYLEKWQVTKKQGRWLSVHAEADLEHGEEALEMVEKYIDEDPKVMHDVALKAGKLWVELIQYSFSVTPRDEGLRKAS